MKKINFLAASCVIMLAAACSKNEPKTTDNLITFSASPLTKAGTIPFTEGNKAKIFVYETSKAAESVKTSYKEFEATCQHDAGVANLVPVTPSVLPKNTYDFLCLSYNNDNITPLTFETPALRTVVVKNQTDFLSGKVTNQAIASAQNISFNLTHRCTSVDLAFAANTSQGITTMTVKTVEVTLPDGTATFDVDAENFTSTPTAFSSSFTAVPAVTNSSSFIVVPMSPAADQKMAIKMICDVTIQGVSYTNRAYSLSLSQTEYTSAKKYTYNCLVGSNEITFGNVTVTDWTVEDKGDITGTDEGTI